MDIATYIESKGGKGTVDCPVLASLAAASGCSHTTLYVIAKGHKKPGPALASRIDKATGGVVRRDSLRPDVFGRAA